MPPTSMPIARRRLISGWLLAAVIAVGSVRALERSRLAGGSKDDFFSGDWGGRRMEWLARGMSFGLNHSLAAYKNTAGSLARVGSLEATTDLNLDFDQGKLAGWRDTRIYVTTAAGLGRSTSKKIIGDVSPVSSYYIPYGLYLQEIWLQQGDVDKQLTACIGKPSSDLECPIYSFSDAIPAPLYPTCGLGVRLSHEPGSTCLFPRPSTTDSRTILFRVLSRTGSTAYGSAALRAPQA